MRLRRNAPTQSRHEDALLNLFARAALLVLLCAVPVADGGATAFASSPGGLTLTDRAVPGDPQSRQFEVRLDQPAPIRLVCDEIGGDQERHVKTSPANTYHTLTIRGLKAATRYTCAAERLDGPEGRSREVTLVTPRLPFDLRAPEITVPSSDVAETGYTLYGYSVLSKTFSFTHNYLVILDASGNIRWYLSGPGAGDVDTSYLGDDQILYGGMTDTFYPPTIVGLDKATLWQGTTAVTTPEEQMGACNHDAGLSEDGTSVFHLAYAKLDGYYLVYVVKQIDLATNQVVWTWSSIEDGLAAGELPPGTGGSTDLYHGNAIDDQWENGRLYIYVSMRNLHNVIKIDYLTKEVVWHLGYGGDFQLLEPDGTPADDSRWFFDQHDVHLYGPNEFSIYDNGSDRGYYGGTPQSRALQLELDQEHRTARIVFEYSEDGWVEPYWGGYDRLANGNSVVAMGHCWLCNSADRRSAIVELDPTAQVVWRADFRSEKEIVYRSERIAGCDIFDNLQYCPK